jgi:hypothetical protein
MQMQLQIRPLPHSYRLAALVITEMLPDQRR